MQRLVRLTRITHLFWVILPWAAVFGRRDSALERQARVVTTVMPHSAEMTRNEAKSRAAGAVFVMALGPPIKGLSARAATPRAAAARLRRVRAHPASAPLPNWPDRGPFGSGWTAERSKPRAPTRERDRPKVPWPWSRIGHARRPPRATRSVNEPARLCSKRAGKAPPLGLEAVTQWLTDRLSDRCRGRSTRRRCPTHGTASACTARSRSTEAAFSDLCHRHWSWLSDLRSQNMEVNRSLTSLRIDHSSAASLARAVLPAPV